MLRDYTSVTAQIFLNIFFILSYFIFMIIKYRFSNKKDFLKIFQWPYSLRKILYDLCRKKVERSCTYWFFYLLKK